ncbi:MAG: pyridoxamine 5'-phosphate oxidase family protein [Candidatus Dormibacteraeota bacterium]|nr:pyridoxamine 5'-phosphate oxidase family protein [Candidatus Dormibacteraeota bacterium]
MGLFADLRLVIESVGWATVATVDSSGRPYTRLLHPAWEFADDGRPVVGWIGTSPTAIKRSHLRRSPNVSVAYWSPAQDTANLECAATWETDREARRHAWEVFRSSPPPMGYDPAPIWPDGPDSESFGLLRLVPYRARVRLLADLIAKRPVRMHVFDPAPASPAG